MINAGLIGERAARQRVLELFAPGVTVQRVREGSCYFVRLSEPVRLDVLRAPGDPLVERDGALSAAPLGPDEWEALAPSPGEWVRVEEGIAVSSPLGGEPVDPAEWLDLSSLRLLVLPTLGAQPPPVELAVRPLEDSLQRLADNLGAPPREKHDVMSALRARIRKEARGEREPAGGAPPASWRLAVPPKLGLFLLRVAATLVASAQALAARRHTVHRPSASTSSSSSSRAAGKGSPEPIEGSPLVPPPGTSWLPRWVARLSTWLARAVALSGVGRLLGRRQAAYLDRLMAMFERGELDQALRHALPLGGKDKIEPERARPALGVPNPRDSLSIAPRAPRPSNALGLPDSLFELLEAHYRRAFQRLVEQGRIDEAAFVLAELLQQNEEAVSFLERHGKLRLAAEVAEARGLPPGLVVRQWFLAGDDERACLIARQTGAFPDAVFRLRKTDPKKAGALQLLWADALASAGDYAAAVELAQPLGDRARPLVLAWLEAGIRQGGPRSWTLRLRKIELVPNAFVEVLPDILTFLEDDGIEQSSWRVQFSDALCDAATKQGVVPLAQREQLALLTRPALRALLIDVRLGASNTQRLRTLRRLERLTDRCLSADLPPVTAPTSPGPLGTAARSLFFPVTDRDAGSQPLFDSALLPNGHMLVALGEAGCLLLHRDGRVLARYDVPCEQLAISAHGDRAIALARRGELYRLSRLDLESRRASTWCDMALTAFAREHDGSTWFVSTAEGVLALDLLAETPRALWRVDRLPGRVGALAWSRSAMSFVVSETRGEQRGAECWRYDVPSLTLRQRSLLTPRLAFLGIAPQHTPSPGGRVAVVQQTPFEGGLAPRVFVEGRSTPLDDGLPDTGAPVFAMAGELQVTDSWMAFPMRIATTHTAGSESPSARRWIQVALWDARDLQPRAHIVLEGAHRATVRLGAEHATVVDDRGRSLALSFEHSELIRDFRL